MGVITVSRARTVFGVALSVLLVALLAAGVLAGGGGKKGNDSIKLTGEAERPGPGDPDGTGRAALQIRPGAERVCFDLSWKNLDPVTMAHIHVGGEDVAVAAREASNQAVQAQAPQVVAHLAGGVVVLAEVSGDEPAKALLVKPPVTACRTWQRAPARAMAR